jgi:SAM-dependent methyltransferase
MSLYDDRYGFPGEFPLYRCSGCDQIFMVQEFEQALLKRLYTDFYPRSQWPLDMIESQKEIHGFSAWLNGSFSTAFRWVPENVRVLDIGCGFGQSLAFYKKRGCDAYGVEPDENIRRIAKKYNFNVHIGLFNPNLYDEDFFDYITMNQVIEHVTNPFETINGITKILKPGGKVIITTPNCHGWGAYFFGQRWINWHVPYHRQFFSEKSINIVAEKAGLQTIKIRTITSSEWLHYQWIHLKMFPQKSTPSVFWSNRIQPKIFEKIWLYIFSLIHKFKFNHFITRFFDIIGLGDSKIYILEKK